MNDVDTFVELYPLIYKILVYLTAPAAIGFPIWYHLRLRWRSSEMGRHVMGYSVVVGLLYVTTILRVTWPGMPLQRLITVVLAALMMVVVWWRVVVFVHIHQQVQREQAKSDRLRRLGEDVPKKSGERSSPS